MSHSIYPSSEMERQKMRERGRVTSPAQGIVTQTMPPSLTMQEAHFPPPMRLSGQFIETAEQEKINLKLLLLEDV